MPDPQDRLAALEEQVAALRTRLTTLEELVSSRVQEGAPPAPHLALTTVSHPDRESLQQRTGTIQGTLSYAGSIQIGERPYRWQRTQTVQPLFEAAPDLLAQIFAALASPHRVIILRTLCERPCTAQQLQEILGMGSAGQLYHHLKELVAAGLIAQRGGSAYTIDPAKVIPVCVALMVASHLATPQQGTAQGAAPPDQEDDLAERT